MVLRTGILRFSLWMRGMIDYTIYDVDGKELDGGVYDNPDISIYEAVKDIVEDLKQKPDTNGTKGAITAESKLNPLNCEEFRDEHICYQEEYGNQDVAPVVIEARREIQEKKEEHLQQKKR